MDFSVVAYIVAGVLLGLWLGLGWKAYRAEQRGYLQGRAEAAQEFARKVEEGLADLAEAVRKRQP